MDNLQITQFKQFKKEANSNKIIPYRGRSKVENNGTVEVLNSVLKWEIIDILSKDKVHHLLDGKKIFVLKVGVDDYHAMRSKDAKTMWAHTHDTYQCDYYMEHDIDLNACTFVNKGNNVHGERMTFSNTTPLDAVTMLLYYEHSLNTTNRESVGSARLRR